MEKTKIRGDLYDKIGDVLLASKASSRKIFRSSLLAYAYLHATHKIKAFSKVRRILDRSKDVSVTTDGYIKATWYDHKKKTWRTTYFAQPTNVLDWDELLASTYNPSRDKIVSYFTIWEAEGLTGFRDLSEYKPFP